MAVLRFKPTFMKLLSQEVILFVLEDKAKDEGPLRRDRGRMQTFAHGLTAALKNLLLAKDWDKTYTVLMLHTVACKSRFFVCDFPGE
jgi:hypothetical protein